MTTSRQPKGIPVGGQFAASTHSEPGLTLPGTAETSVGDLLERQFDDAKDRYEAYAQNDWAADVRRKYPEAHYAYVGVTNDRGGRYTAGMGLFAADGEEIEVAEDDQVYFEDGFNVFWDMDAHRDEDLNDSPGDSEMFSLDSIKNKWDGLQAQSTPSSDPFAHLSGMERARAQAAYSNEISREATSAYVQDLSAKLLAINPQFGRLYVNRKVDVDGGLTFRLDRVEDIHRNASSIDVAVFEDTTFQDVHLDGHVDLDETTGDLYINIDPGN